MGEALGNVCTDDGGFLIQYLPSGYMYSGLGSTYATNCACNTVYYNLLSACAQCQGGSVDVWDNWSKNCTTTYSTFPNSIPDGSAIPHWAYLPLNNGTWDFASAQTDEGAEATFTGSHSASATASSTRTTSANSPSGSSSGSNGGSSNSKGSNHAGAIAGGVIGGVALLALIGLGFFLWRRNKAKKAKGTPETSFLGPNMTGTTYAHDGAGFAAPAPYDQHSTMSGAAPAKLYDPNDPSTFPSAFPAAGTPTNASFVGSGGASYPQQHTGSTYAPVAPDSPGPFGAPPNTFGGGPNRYSQNHGQGGAYSGAPEL
ncbi:hypothetical protein CYLTODRAFT_423463 [Cylindrobasidium torrendii FP15055 ss-10]|uniref:Uncharacterized protein n=1 Tax=Cylindrobasidium torrendii FP15055 ss-10 TaxID=1314674 RepID=A0A0D7B743_9AGAR|nr:hypothetical protein CYLTODRAFT_423463 [Cylindrobasidium torrendii FP15055 ss-10]